MSSLNYHKGTKTTTFADGEFKVEANKSFEPFSSVRNKARKAWWQHLAFFCALLFTTTITTTTTKCSTFFFITSHFFKVWKFVSEYFNYFRCKYVLILSTTKWKDESTNLMKSKSATYSTTCKINKIVHFGHNEAEKSNTYGSYRR